MVRIYINKKSGFTLVEMSVVLVIISFLIVGVLAGKDLMRSSQVGTVVSDTQKYISAIELFEDRYSGLPGDMFDANTIFTGTADGDGNNRIDTSAESLRAWQHFVLASMIEGGYTGTGNFTLETNIPSSKIENAGYLPSYVTVLGRSGNAILFGSITGSTAIDGAVLTSREAWEIDRKTDDGVANTGAVRTVNGNSVTGCIASNDYDINVDGIKCTMTFFINR